MICSFHKKREGKDPKWCGYCAMDAGYGEGRESAERMAVATIIALKKEIARLKRAEKKAANLRIALPIADLTTELRPRRKRG